jgi:hypothetical protein
LKYVDERGERERERERERWFMIVGGFEYLS